MKYLNVLEIKELVEKDLALVVDVREPYEVQICDTCSLKIPMGEICSSIDELKTDKLLVIMCKTGKRAEAVANLLNIDFGIKNVAVMEGGMMSWIEKVESNLEVY